MKYRLGVGALPAFRFLFPDASELRIREHRAGRRHDFRAAVPFRSRAVEMLLVLGRPKPGEA